MKAITIVPALYLPHKFIKLTVQHRRDQSRQVGGRQGI
jgi:hypothetical protein